MNSEYLDSSTLISLETSLPDLSGLVQYKPLALLPLTESGSPGICVKQIAPKCSIPHHRQIFLFEQFDYRHLLAC